MGKVTRRPKQTKPAQPTFNVYDDIDRQAVEAAVDQVIRGFLSRIDHTRQIGTMNKDDLRSIAHDMITGFVLKRAELNACLEKDPNFNAPFALGS